MSFHLKTTAQRYAIRAWIRAIEILRILHYFVTVYICYFLNRADDKRIRFKWRRTNSFLPPRAICHISSSRSHQSSSSRGQFSDHNYLLPRPVTQTCICGVKGWSKLLTEDIHRANMMKGTSPNTDKPSMDGLPPKPNTVKSISDRKLFHSYQLYIQINYLGSTYIYTTKYSHRNYSYQWIISNPKHRRKVTDDCFSKILHEILH